MSNEEIIAAINQFDIREVRDINGLWNTLQECRAALESRAISDTHRVVSVEDLRGMQWAFEDHRAGFMVDKILAIIDKEQS